MNNTMIISRRNLLKRAVYGGAAGFLPLNLFSQPNFSELQETLNGILQNCTILSTKIRLD